MRCDAMEGEQSHVSTSRVYVHVHVHARAVRHARIPHYHHAPDMHVLRGDDRRFDYR